MIKKFESRYLGRVMEIWLNTNKEAHSFLPEKYWDHHFQQVKEILPEANVWIFLEEDYPAGFVGVSDGYIAGIFVDSHYQGQGIGGLLLEKIKNEHEELTLDVYEKNTGAVNFYKHNGFMIESKETEDETGFMEYFMKWKKD